MACFRSQHRAVVTPLICLATKTLLAACAHLKDRLMHAQAALIAGHSIMLIVGKAATRPGLHVNKLQISTLTDLQPCCSPVIVVLWVPGASLDGP